ncbi:MAG: type II toxin-antitoxin system HicB family antitoxin [Elusimicrobia bacterium]|nr:type II toxin-antitoxin system HicB family antitoxin [Elusimicrobiota bacterium]
MLVEYIHAALAKARFEKIEDSEPVYGEIPGLRGVWATGKNRETCRRNLAAVLDGWIIVRLRKGLDIPKVGGKSLTHATRLTANV